MTARAARPVPEGVVRWHDLGDREQTVRNDAPFGDHGDTGVQEPIEQANVGEAPAKTAPPIVRISRIRSFAASVLP
mgnify:CR=1 FL=1